MAAAPGARLMARPSLRWVLRRLVRSGLLTAGSAAAFAGTALVGGVNLASLLRYAARRRGDALALVDEHERVTFAELARQADRMAAALRDTHAIGRGDVVGIVGRNGADLARAIFAAARLGARVTLLNPDMSRPQLLDLVESHRMRLVIAAAFPEEALHGSPCPVIAADRLLRGSAPTYRRLGRVAGGELVVLTGGTTGRPKAARRKPSPRNFLLLFAHLVAALELDRHPSAYVAVPLFHGYGIAAFLIAVALGRTVYMAERFDAGAACALTDEQRIPVLVVVPSMLQRILDQPASLSSIRCVISGGAALPPTLAVRTRERLGDIFFNLYGTGEAGVAVFATPADLAEAPDTIGREIWGVTVTIRGARDEDLPQGGVGRICVQSRAAVAPGEWIETGDLGYRDAGGRLFVRGRVDDMIVSGGENVSPAELEAVLLTHPGVGEAAAVGVSDADFGQRLVAFAVPSAGGSLCPDALTAWLTGRVARYQRPREIRIAPALPLTAVGKIDRRALAALCDAPAQTKTPAGEGGGSGF